MMARFLWYLDPLSLKKEEEEKNRCQSSGPDQIRMEFRKECFVNLNIWACKSKYTKHQYCWISDFVAQKPMRMRSISKYHFQHPTDTWYFSRLKDSYASDGLSLSPICFQSLQIVWMQKISDVLPNQIRGKQAYQELIMKANVRLCIRCLERIWLSSDMRFPTMWYVGPAKPQISLRICTVCSEPLLVAWIIYEC